MIHQNWWRKQSQTLSWQIKIEDISGSRVWNFIKFTFIHETIKRAGKVRKFLYKNQLNLACLWSRLWLALNKKKTIFRYQKYFSLPDHQAAENLVLISGFCKRTKKG